MIMGSEEDTSAVGVFDACPPWASVSLQPARPEPCSGRACFQGYEDHCWKTTCELIQRGPEGSVRPQGQSLICSLQKLDLLPFFVLFGFKFIFLFGFDLDSL